MGGHNNYKNQDPIVELAANALAAVAARQREYEKHEQDTLRKQSQQHDSSRQQKQHDLAVPGVQGVLYPEKVKSCSMDYCARSPSSIMSNSKVFANTSHRCSLPEEEDPLYYHPSYTTNTTKGDPHPPKQPHDDLDCDDDDHTAHTHDKDANSGEHGVHGGGDNSNKINTKITTRRSYRRSTRKKPTPSDPGFTAKHYRRHFVRHNYHDHSHDKEQDILVATGQVDALSAKGGVVTAFPLVLYNMLSSVEEQGLSAIVSWQPHGRAFSVHDTKAFVRQVMPTFFRQSKISSFQRQLNLYGFCRLTGQGPDRGAYYNEFFLRGRPDLTVHMQRTRVKGTGVRTSSNPKQEPNFYEMEPVGEEADGHHHQHGVDEPQRPTSVVTIITPRPPSVHPLESTNRQLFPSNDKKPRFVYQNSVSWNPSPSLYDILECHHGEFDDRASPVTSDPFDSSSLPTPDDDDDTSLTMDFGDDDVVDMALFLKDVDLGSVVGEPFKVESRMPFQAKDLDRIYKTEDV